MWKSCVYSCSISIVLVFLTVSSRAENITPGRPARGIRGGIDMTMLTDGEDIKDSDVNPMPQTADYTGSSGEDEQEQLEEAIHILAISQIAEAMRESVKDNGKVLSTLLERTTNRIHTELKAHFDNRKLGKLMEEVYAQLAVEMNEAFREKAGVLATKKTNEILDVVRKDKDIGIKTKSIIEHLKQVKDPILSLLKDEINDAAKQIKHSFETKARQIVEKEIKSIALESNDDGKDAGEILGMIYATARDNIENMSSNAEAKAAEEESKNAQQLEETISEAITDVDEAEEEEIQANQSMLTSSMKKVEDMVKFELGRVFGNDGSMAVEEMAEIAQEVTTRLEDEVQEEFREKADTLADKKVEEIEEVVEEEEDVGIKTKNIREDVKQVEELAVEELKDEIDDAAKDVTDHLKEKAIRITKEVVNAHLKRKSGTGTVTGDDGDFVKILFSGSLAEGRKRKDVKEDAIDNSMEIAETPTIIE